MGECCAMVSKRNDYGTCGEPAERVTVGGIPFMLCGEHRAQFMRFWRDGD